MDKGMKFKESRRINKKIITPSDIRRISKELVSERDKERARHQEKFKKTESDLIDIGFYSPSDIYAEFEIEYKPARSIEGDDLNDLVQEDILETRRVEKLSMRFGNRIDDNRIYISIEKGSAYFSVESKDQKWLDAYIKRMSEIFDDCKPQYGTRLIKILFIVFFPIVIGLLISTTGITLLELFVANYQYQFKDSVQLFVYPAIIAIFYSAYSPLEKIDKIYPSIELATGPEHMQYEKIARDKMKNLWYTIVAPLILSILTTVISLSLT